MLSLPDTDCWHCMIEVVVQDMCYIVHRTDRSMIMHRLVYAAFNQVRHRENNCFTLSMYLY